MGLVLPVVVPIAVVLFLIAAVRRLRGRGRPGNAAVGAYDELLIKDKRRAIEIVIEEKAEHRDLTRPGDKPLEDQLANNK